MRNYEMWSLISIEALQIYAHVRVGVGNHIAAFIERREDKEDISTSACVKELCICSDIQSPAHMFPFFFAFCWSF